MALVLTYHTGIWGVLYLPPTFETVHVSGMPDTRYLIADSPSVHAYPNLSSDLITRVSRTETDGILGICLDLTVERKHEVSLIAIWVIHPERLIVHLSVDLMETTSSPCRATSALTGSEECSFLIRSSE